MTKTIQETIDELHTSLKDYIEATYHIGDPKLIRQRRILLDQPGVTHQIPYLESTPKYQVGHRYKDMIGLPPAALSVYSALSTPNSEGARLLFDPPYRHQAEAIRNALIDDKNLVIMTGTGSGKTESFLLPILGKFAREAAARPQVFAEQRGVRALLLYPMNALVNDQLGRLRAIFGDPRLVKLFAQWAKRTPTFARYTSRTPYAGVRSGKRDSKKLASFESFYVEIERQASGAPSETQELAEKLRRELKARGKWPAKPDLQKWFGAKGTPWADRKSGEPLRAVTLDGDSELITRHEAQTEAPDLLVTNYSMLEYMLMRPIERTIFDQTSAWLASNPDEKFTVVLDEAHLYRGAAGAEVGLLLRRLRARLGIPVERFQIICATASFSNPKEAGEFGAQLSGAPVASFVSITGELDLRPHAAPGSGEDAAVLASIDLDQFYASEEAVRKAAVAPFLAHRHVAPMATLEKSLFAALETFAPLGLLVNLTMKAARPVESLGEVLFPDAPDLSARALTALLALGSVARESPDAAGLLPCRIHNFYRGLAGLWVCMDPECSELASEQRSGACGRMYSQPRGVCGCGSRVLEFYTCRNCGAAHARAHSDDVDTPNALWPEPGRRLKMPGLETAPLLDLDLLLVEPRLTDLVELAEYDLETGRINPPLPGPRSRTVYLRKDRTTPATDEDGEVDTRAEVRGQFTPCAVCGETAAFGRTSVQDHQTKGDQPFQALVARQIQVQPPGPQTATNFAPLRGRKVLVFSDSRQVAARLAPNLQLYSVRDALRSLIVWGYDKLRQQPMVAQMLNLGDLYVAVILASKAMGVRLRPELKPGETFATDSEIAAAVLDGVLEDATKLTMLWMRHRGDLVPQSLLDDIVKTVQDRYLGLEALALASICESADRIPAIHALPNIPGLAETDIEKVELARTWLRCWRANGFWLNAMPPTWYKRPKGRGTSVRAQKGGFKAMQRVLSDSATRKLFDRTWQQQLMSIFTEEMDSGYKRLAGKNLSLELNGSWVRCGDCRSVHRPMSRVPRCLDCSSTNIEPLDPIADPVFTARKGYYRNPVIAALSDPNRKPMALIAAEHTAQLNAPQSEDVFSRAEENELLFQDVALDWGAAAKRSTAIDVLSSTTTMEVGIDIGALSGVALRNMPPGRANYQQRAGRAGRRGNAVATVVAFGSADSHDEHYFSQPETMIAGPVVDPRLTLNNPDIVQRHIRAFLLQNYHQDRIPGFDPDADPNLFSVLGTVEGFKSGTEVLNRDDFARWLEANEEALRVRVADWIPAELGAHREALLDQMVKDVLEAVDEALSVNSPGGQKVVEEDDEGEDEDSPEIQEEEGEEVPNNRALTGKLLDRLLYRGVLPRYAFPTDVATFNVFDIDRSTAFRPIMKFAPSQSLPVALSQYAPGKTVWIAGKCYTSGAIYAPMQNDRFDAWQSRRLYRECTECHFAETVPLDSGLRPGVTHDCRACGGESTFGPTHFWMRPPGFAHPVYEEEMTSPDDMPETAHATRAKLTMPTPADDEKWIVVNDRLRAMPDRKHLLVSNTGPKQEGYNYCTKCGRIEASVEGSAALGGPHPKPYPDDKEPECPGSGTTRGLVLGTDFITDIALFSLRVAAPLKLKPGLYPTDVALRSVSEALAKAAASMLEIEPGELLAEYRPALTPAGSNGLEAEIFLYDTLPGGAGFASQVAHRGSELFDRALTLMKTCPEDCDSSCYRCLRSFKNKFEHSLIDRHVGAELLEYAITGEMQPFDARRIRASSRLLQQDLERQTDGFTFTANEELNAPGVGPVTIPILAVRSDGKRFAICLSGALTGDHPTDPAIALMRETWSEIKVIPVNELLVRGNLPAATRSVQAAIRQ